jgi:hypothetical protein
VGLHVGEVLENINRIPYLEAKEREQLRLVALAHDTFKYAEDRSRPRNWEKHHAVLARKFMEKYTRDTTVLNLIEAHDDAYYLWLGASRSGELFILKNSSKEWAAISDCTTCFSNAIPRRAIKPRHPSAGSKS